MELLTVPTATAVVYAVVAAITKATGNNETFKRFIPLVSLGLGALFGLLAFYFLPDLLTAKNVVEGMVVCGISGLAATGTDQAIKQLTKKESEKESETKE